MKSIINNFLLTACGAAFGFFLDTFVSKKGVDPPTFGILPRIVGADGEAAYDLITLEIMIIWALVFLVTWMILKRIKARRVN